jgi:hypothetical protein
LQIVAASSAAASSRPSLKAVTPISCEQSFTIGRTPSRSQS